MKNKQRNRKKKICSSLFCLRNFVFFVDQIFSGEKNKNNHSSKRTNNRIIVIVLTKSKNLVFLCFAQIIFQTKKLAKERKCRTTRELVKACRTGNCETITGSRSKCECIVQRWCSVIRRVGASSQLSAQQSVQTADTTIKVRRATIQRRLRCRLKHMYRSNHKRELHFDASLFFITWVMLIFASLYWTWNIKSELYKKKKKVSMNNIFETNLRTTSSAFGAGITYRTNYPIL